MPYLNEYSLSINDPKIAQDYIASNNKKTFFAALIILIFRITRLIIYMAGNEAFLYFESYNNVILRWTTFGIMILLIIVLKIWT